MSRIVIACVTLLLLTLGAGSAQAALTYVNLGGESWTLHTASTTGLCHVSGSGSDFTVTCDDQDGNAATLDSRRGCIQVLGRALCAVGVWDLGVDTAATLTCGNGSKFNVSAGTQSETCNEGSQDGGSLECSGPGPEQGQTSFASANCTEGCGDSAGAGCCCNLATEGCKVGKTCH